MVALAWMIQGAGEARLVTDHIVPVLAVVSGSHVPGGLRCCPMRSGRRRLRPRRGGILSGSRDGVAGQAGAGRAQSRRHQARRASFQGQIRLIFSMRRGRDGSVGRAG
jgi:hypothetical protein